MEGLTKKRELSTVTAEIRMLTEQAGALALDYAVEIGRRLTEARELVEHGGWEDYLGEIGYKKSTANNFMRVYREYGDPQGSLFGASCKSEVLGKLTYSKALELLALPEEARETFAAEVDAEHISTRELKTAIRERDEARAQLEKAKEAALASHKEKNRLCAELEEAKKGAGSTAETEALRKQLALAAPELQEFRVLFTTWQETFNRMQGIAEKLRVTGREENAGKLHAAMTAALEQMQKGMRDGN